MSQNRARGYYTAALKDAACGFNSVIQLSLAYRGGYALKIHEIRTF